MRTWGNVDLFEVAAIFNGKTPSKSEQRSDGHPVLKIRDVSDYGEFRGSFGSFVDHRLADVFASKQLLLGDCLILNAAHNADYVGSKTYRVRERVVGALATGEWLVIRPEQSRLDPAFAFHFINSSESRTAIRDMVKGIHLYPKDVARLRVPLPSLQDQRRIADVLDKADALRAKRRAALAQLDTVSQAIFLHMFGDPLTNPRHWTHGLLGDVADVQGGLQVTSKRESLPLSVPYLRVANVFRGKLRLDVVKSMRASEGEVSRTRLEGNDLLMVEGHGNPDEVGRAALWDGSIAHCIHQNHLIRARLTSSSLLPRFVLFLLNSKMGKSFFHRSGKTTSGLNTISVSQVRRVPLLVPPVSLQQAFVDQLAVLDSIREGSEASLAAFDALFSSLQHRAFRGEL